MILTNKQSRRHFLRNLAKTGSLLPFAGQLLGQKVFAQDAGAKRVLFLYYPNGVVPYNWRPEQFDGAISSAGELSFGLGPLAPWHQKLIVLKNLTLDIGPGAGAHANDARGILTGNNQIDAASASIDHLIAEQLGDEGVLNLGVRTGPKSDMMISKPRGFDTTQRPIPTRIGGGGGEISEEALRMYEAILSDFDGLSDLELSQARRDKLTRHENALRRLMDQASTQVGDCGFTTNRPADPFAAAEQPLSPP